MNVIDLPSIDSRLRTRTCIIVAGMHRSGSSAITRIVNLFGAEVAKELLPPAPDNERGFWESVRVVEIHDRLLHALSSSYDDAFPLPEAWMQTKAAQQAMLELTEDIKKNFADGDFFVVKDPRISRLLPLWLRLLDDMLIEPIVVVPVRNPLEIAASLRKRDRFSLAKSLIMYLRSSLETELVSRGRRRLFVRYDQLLCDWSSFATRLAKLTDGRLPRARAASIIEINSFLSSDLRHNRFTRDQLSNAVDIAPLVVEAFDCLVNGADGGDQTQLERTFDDLRERFAEATKLFQGLLLSERETARESVARIRSEQHSATQSLVEELAKVKSDIISGHSRVAELDAALGAQFAENLQLHEELSASRRQVADLGVTLSARLADIVRLSEQLSESCNQLATLNSKFLSHSSASLQLSNQLSASCQRIAELESVQTAQSVEVGRLEAELVTSRNQVAKINELLDARSARMDKLESELKAERKRATDLDVIVAASLIEKANLSAELIKAQVRSVELIEAETRAAYLEHALETAARKRVVDASRPFTRPIHWIKNFFRLRSNRKVVTTSGLLDRDWYLENYPDIAAAGVDPARHYLRYGASEGRNPGPLFDTSWYLQQYPDVRVAGVNPLIHYLRYGALEGRDPNPLFDSDWYLQQNPDVEPAAVNPLVHYLRQGAGEGLDPNSLFDSDWYTKRHSEVCPAGVNPLVHYLEEGAKRGIDPSPLFDSDWYLEQNPDVRRAEMNPLAHYVRYGAAQGRDPKPRPKPAAESAVIVPNKIDCYSAWLACNSPHERALQALREALSARSDRLPRISVIMPVYNTPTELLDQTIASVMSQVYSDWELCVADDASSAEHVARDLDRWARLDRRIRVLHRDLNGGIGVATNAAAALATGEFLAFLDHDDLLTPDALAEVAIYASDHPTADVIYSDDDKVDMNGRRFAPQFKPDWSPTLLLSYMYLGHLLVVRRDLFRLVGGIRTGFDGAQDYDMALRATERARNVGHIPRILYNWRVAPGSVAVTTDAKPHSLTAGLRAVTEAVARRGIDAVIDQPAWAQAAKIGVYCSTFSDDGPRVAILIPTRNRLDLLSTCISSLQKTTYRNYEVVILDNESDDPATLKFLSNCGHRVLRVSSPSEKFSFAYINNIGANQVKADYILLLNNDTEVINSRWLSQMVGYARMPQVGAVGAKLLYRDGTIQHNGIVHGYHDGTAGHAFKNMSDDDHGYHLYLKVPRECSGVTGACLLTLRDLFLEVGGLDEAAFAVAYNDVDYCYRLIDRGYRCVICPDATLYHDEGKSRGFEDNPAELAILRQRYSRRVDPYYNPNLSLDNEHFQIRPYRYPLAHSSPIRTVAISHNLNHEGAPNSQFEMIVGLQQRGVIDPVVLSPCDGPLRRDYEAAGISVHLISPSVGGKSEFDKSIGMVAQILRESGAEVVYCNTLQTFWAVAAAKRGEIPALWNVRESEPWQSYFDFLSPDVRAEAYSSFSYPYRVIFVAHATRRAWEPLNSAHNFATIHNGLDLERLRSRAAGCERMRDRIELGIAESELGVVLLGTVCERKGQLDLVRALQRLPLELCSRLRFFIVGDRPGSPYSEQLHAEAGALPPAIAHRLIIVPETGEPYRYLRASDIAVCCSRIESYPRVTLEAMAFGLPVLTTPVFGIFEQVRNEVNGLFYNPGDISKLADNLARLAVDSETRIRLASNSPFVLASLPGLEEMLSSYGRLFQEARLSSGSGADSISPFTVKRVQTRCAA
jgi:GT2 family glycosyltransferase